MTTLFEVIHRNAEPYKIKLIKGQKDTYGWEITANACTFGCAITLIQAADAMLREKFGGDEKT